jgi:hypothetical protein
LKIATTSAILGRTLQTGDVNNSNVTLVLSTHFFTDITRHVVSNVTLVLSTHFFTDITRHVVAGTSKTRDSQPKLKIQLFIISVFSMSSATK